MYFYTVYKIGIGNEENPIRPNAPENLPYVWNPDSVCPTCNTYIIASSEYVVDLRLTSVLSLRQACENRNLIYEDVVKWNVGEG